MTEVELRIPLGVGESLRDTVFRPGRHEYVAIGLVSYARLGDRDVLFLRHLLDLPESAYRRDGGHGAAWSGSAMIPAITTAIDETLGIVIFHAHAHDGPPRLSGDDQTSADRLIPMFKARVPTRPHGSVVLSRTHAGGFIVMPDAPAPQTRIDVRWLGASIVDWRTTKPSATPARSASQQARD